LAMRLQTKHRQKTSEVRLPVLPRSRLCVVAKDANLRL
jgi:hypothetical protein